MITDLAEVFRLGTEKAEENLAFRRWLSKKHQADEQVFQIIASEVAAQIDCTKCANCCRHGEVPVDGAEIEAIAQHLGTTAPEVKRLYMEGQNLKSGEAGCVFLDGTMCMVYEARPKACRDFPHVTPGSHTLGGRAGSHARWAPRCPIVYNALERHKHVVGYLPCKE